MNVDPHKIEGLHAYKFGNLAIVYGLDSRGKLSLVTVAVVIDGHAMLPSMSTSDLRRCPS